MVDEPQKESVIARLARAIAEERASLKAKFIVPSGRTKRVRFISDMDDAIPVRMHYSWSKLYPTSCQSHLGRACPYCGDHSYKTAEWYALTVSDLDEKELKVLAGSASSWSPIPEMMNRFEEHGTLTDRVYKIRKRNLRKRISWVVVAEGEKRDWKRHFTPFSDREVYEVLNWGLKIKAL